MKPKNVQEPMKQHVDGDGPWQQVGPDIFQIADKHYFVTVDYYSPTSLKLIYLQP